MALVLRGSASGTALILRSAVPSRSIESSATLSAAVSIVSRSADQVAPEGFWLECVLTGSTKTKPVATTVWDADFHGYTYKWTITSAPSPSNFASPVTEWASYQTFYGKFISFVAMAAGTYNATCQVIDKATRTVVATTPSQALSVGNPNTVFSGTRTILYDPTGTGDNATYPGSQVFTTIAGCLSAYQALGQTGQLLIKGGEAVDFLISGTEFRIDSSYPNFRLGVWGTGRWTMNLSATARGIDRTTLAGDMAIWGGDITGSYDPVTETGATGEAFSSFRTGGSFGSTVLADLNVSGATKINLQGDGATGYFHFFDVTVTDWQDYGTLIGADGIYVGMSSFSAIQNPAAMGGGDGTSGDGDNAHGPLRWGSQGTAASGLSSARFWCDNIELRTHNGWSTAGSVPSHQAAFRTGGGDETCYIFMSRVLAEGGGIAGQLALTDTANGAEVRPMNLIGDTFVMIGSHNSQKAVHVSFDGTELCDGMLIQPNTQNDVTWGGFIEYTDAGDVADNLLGIISVHSCTMVSLLDTTNSSETTPEVRASGVFANEVRSNNVLHWPDMTSPTSSDTPFTLLERFTPATVSRQYATNSTPDYTYGSPTHELAYDAETGTFTAGLVVTNGSTFSARIAGLRDDGTTGTLLLCDVTAGDLADNDTITDSATGSATANGTLVSTGVGAIWRPTTSSAADGSATGDWIAPDDITGTLRPAVSPSRGCIEAA